MFKEDFPMTEATNIITVCMLYWLSEQRPSPLISNDMNVVSERQ